MVSEMQVRKYCNHSKKAIRIAIRNGWLPGARYTNLRDIKHLEFENIGFVDIHWKKYCFARHVDAVSELRPHMTVARDLECISELDTVIQQAEKLHEHCEHVVVVPKDKRLHGKVDDLIPPHFLLGYSIPTRYGDTELKLENFIRPTHLLGGRPDIQRRLAEVIPVYSIDCNRFTLDARYGDYFDGETFRPHPSGGYEACLADSITNINTLWDDYELDNELLESVGRTNAG